LAGEEVDKRVLIPEHMPGRARLERALRDHGWQPRSYRDIDDAEKALGETPASALLLSGQDDEPRRLRLVKKIRRTWPQTLLLGMGEEADSPDTDTVISRRSTPEEIAVAVSLGKRLRTSQAAETALREQLDHLRKALRRQTGRIRRLESTCDELRTQAQTAREMALRDDLTGLYNRRHFQHVAAQELERARREQGRFAIAMIDLDHFKQQNDTHGHIVGDHILREFAGALLDNLRRMDTVARYGGEEFIALLPQTRITRRDHFSPVRLIERIRRRIQTMRFCRLETPKPVRLTFSAGVVQYPEDGATVNSLIVKADRRLYEAKSRGRNRICAADS